MKELKKRNRRNFKNESNIENRGLVYDTNKYVCNFQQCETIRRFCW